MVSMLRKAMVGVVAVGLTGAGAVAQSTVRIDGSSTVYPITEAVAEEFQKAHPGTKVTIGVSGTGGGFKKFVRGETDISNASRPIKEAEIKQAADAGIGFVEVPVAFDALTVVVNPSNDWAKELTVTDLKKIWAPEAQGTVKSWRDVRPEWPDVPLKLYGPGGDSGTFEYFTEAVVGKAKSSRGDYTASEDDNVLVQGVSGDKGGLGYFGYAYYAENRDKVRAVPIVNRAGTAVMPSPEAVKDGTYNPLARPIFIYVADKSLTGNANVRKFVDFYLDNAADLVAEVKYVPLPDEAYESLARRVEAGTTGSVFGGKEQVGMTIEQLVSAEMK